MHVEVSAPFLSQKDEYLTSDMETYLSGGGPEKTERLGLSEPQPGTPSVGCSRVNLVQS